MLQCQPCNNWTADSSVIY